MQVPFITTDTFEGHYPVNWYFQKQGWNGRPALLPTPGLLLWSDPGYASEVRGIKKLNANIAYAVCGNRVYSLDTSGNANLCTGTLLSNEDIVEMETNGTYMMITDGTYGYYISGTVVTRIIDPDFPFPSSLTYQDGYFIVTEKDSGKYFISGLNDPRSWSSLDYATAEGLPDNGVRVFSSHRELLNFQEESMEPFQNTGASDFPFERISGGFMECGLGARETVAKLDNSVAWLADDFTIKAMSQNVPVTIAPEALCRIIDGYAMKKDAFAYSFKKNGNWFYAITFPTESKTWLGNSTTKAWCQWSSGLIGGRHRSNCHCFFAGKNLVGDYDNGKIYELSDTTYSDDGNPIRHVRVSPPLFDPDGKRNVIYHTLEVEFKAGVGTQTGQGIDPQAMLRYSNDSCRTWSNEKWQGIGKIGRFKDRARWHQLGGSRMRNWELSATDPVEWVLLGAYADVSLGMS